MRPPKPDMKSQMAAGNGTTFKLVISPKAEPLLGEKAKSILLKSGKSAKLSAVGKLVFVNAFPVRLVSPKNN